MFCVAQTHNAYEREIATRCAITISGCAVEDREVALRMLIRTLRLAGFNGGFTELAIDTFTGESLSGGTLLGSLEHVCCFGPVPVAP